MTKNSKLKHRIDRKLRKLFRLKAKVVILDDNPLSITSYLEEYGDEDVEV
jgi:hypothetical protein